MAQITANRPSCILTEIVETWHDKAVAEQQDEARVPGIRPVDPWEMVAVRRKHERLPIEGARC